MPNHERRTVRFIFFQRTAPSLFYIYRYKYIYIYIFFTFYLNTFLKNYVCTLMYSLCDTKWQLTFSKKLSHRILFTTFKQVFLIIILYHGHSCNLCKLVFTNCLHEEWNNTAVDAFQCKRKWTFANIESVVYVIRESQEAWGKFRRNSKRLIINLAPKGQKGAHESDSVSKHL